MSKVGIDMKMMVVEGTCMETKCNWRGNASITYDPADRVDTQNHLAQMIEHIANMRHIHEIHVDVRIEQL